MLACEELLEQLPALQQLLYRLIGCQVTFYMDYLTSGLFGIAISISVFLKITFFKLLLFKIDKGIW
jgi:hypothetical protein